MSGYKIVKYDDASWHFEGDFPEGKTLEHAATHMGLFLRLMFDHGFASDAAKKDFAKEISQLRTGAMSGTDFVVKCMDGKMTSDEFSEDGNAFTEHYYMSEKTPDFIDDAQRYSGIVLYEDLEGSADYQSLNSIFQKRVKEFRGVKQNTSKTHAIFGSLFGKGR